MSLRKSIKSIIFLLVVLTAIPAVAQKKNKPLKKARITFEITYENADEMEAAQLAMMPSESYTYIMGDNTREELTFGPTTFYTIKNFTTSTIIQLIDAMGQKMYIETSKEELEEESEMFSNIEISFPDEVKEIAGYNCKKAIVSYDDENLDERQSSVVFYTEELGNENTNFAGALYKKVPGRLMQYSINIMELKMILIAKSVDKAKIKDTYFMIPTDYKKITKEDLQGGGQ